MIFDSNTTHVGTSIPMAEGYDSYGVELALYESAQNDYNMFKAMMGADCTEARLRFGSNVVNEAEIMALNESAVGSIWSKIKQLITKLIAKIKAIFHTFMSKLNSLFLTDKQMVKKYRVEINKKTNLGNMEVTWSKEKGSLEGGTVSNVDALVSDYMSKIDSNAKEETSSSDRVDAYLAKLIAGSDQSSFREDFHDKYFESSEKVQLKETPGINAIMSYLEGAAKTIEAVKKTNTNTETALGKILKKCEDELSNVAKLNPAGKEGKLSYTDREGKTQEVDATESAVQAKVKEARIAYDEAQALQTATLLNCSCLMDAHKFKYKMYKAAFMKAIAVNDKKLQESAIYADAISEAAAQEVTEVIDGALKKEELSKICNASKDVIGADIPDDPSVLTYGPDCYTPNKSYVSTDGSVDTQVASRKESSIFTDLLY